MAMWTNCGKPNVECVCGGVRALPVETCGDPPVGMESFCVDCSQVLVLTSYSADRRRWSWTVAEPPPSVIETVNLIARRALAVEAALAGFGHTWREWGRA